MKRKVGHLFLVRLVVVKMRKFKVVRDKVYIPKFFRGYKEFPVNDVKYIYIGRDYTSGYGNHRIYIMKGGKYVPYIAILSEMKVCYLDVDALSYSDRNELLCYQRYDEETFLQLLENGFNGRICVWHKIYNDNFLERWTQLAREGKLDMEKVQLIYGKTMIY